MTLLQAKGLCLDAPGGRALIRDLSLSLEAGERVAIVGRNGVGKSSLLATLSGERPPDGGRVLFHGRRTLVPQLLPTPAGVACSPGQWRRQCLQQARLAEPDLLLLDEPSHDLDDDGLTWLRGLASGFAGGLILVSHDRRLLGDFQDFFVVAESGCFHHRGPFAGLLAELEVRRGREQARYVRNLSRLVERERRHDVIQRRRQRKQNLGRIHELGRCPSRAKLNENRSYAQESQGRRAVLQRERLDAARLWVQATRRALSVSLPLELALSRLPEPGGGPVVALREVVVSRAGRPVLDGLSLCVGRERIGVVGPNGAGKTTLLQTAVGERRPERGQVECHHDRIGYIAQNASNFQRAESLVGSLLVGAGCGGLDEVAGVLRAHRFPFGLADRPLASLSPGERLRAALICLTRREPAPELLVLDEPGDHLDLEGAAALERVLAAWPGGLMVASHDLGLLARIGCVATVGLAGPRVAVAPTAGQVG